MNYKGYIIKPSKQFPSHYVVATEGQGGKIPSVLDSLFTSTGFAMTVIDAYVNSKAEKGAKNAKTDQEG